MSGCRRGWLALAIACVSASGCKRAGHEAETVLSPATAADVPATSPEAASPLPAAEPAPSEASAIPAAPAAQAVSAAAPEAPLPGSQVPPKRVAAHASPARAARKGGALVKLAAARNVSDANTSSAKPPLSDFGGRR